MECLYSFNQTILSSISLQIVCACNLLKKTFTPSRSQSWIYLVNWGFQLPSSPSYSHTSAGTHASFYLSKTKMECLYSFNQTILSSISLEIVCVCDLLKKTFTPSRSQSWIYLVNWGFQLPSSPSYSHTSAGTHAIFGSGYWEQYRKSLPQEYTTPPYPFRISPSIHTSPPPWNQLYYNVYLY